MCGTSSSSAIAVWRAPPPQSNTRVNSAIPPPATSSVDASCPIATTTVALSSVRLREPNGWDEGAEEAEGLEVDARKADARLAACLDVRLDLVAGCDDEQDTAHDFAALRVPLLDDAVVQHRLVRGDRQHLVRLEPNGVVEARIVLDACDVERPDADAADESPSRTFLTGRWASLKNVFNARTRASGSRSSPPTTTPCSSGRRATSTSAGRSPLPDTTAAAICDAPTLRPTTFLPRDPPPFRRLRGTDSLTTSSRAESIS